MDVGQGRKGFNRRLIFIHPAFLSTLRSCSQRGVQRVLRRSHLLHAATPLCGLRALLWIRRAETSVVQSVSCITLHSVVCRVRHEAGLLLLLTSQRNTLQPYR